MTATSNDVSLDALAPLLAPATTALILRRKRASEIDGAVPALEVGGVN